MYGSTWRATVLLPAWRWLLVWRAGVPAGCRRGLYLRVPAVTYASIHTGPTCGFMQLPVRLLFLHSSRCSCVLPLHNNAFLRTWILSLSTSYVFVAACILHFVSGLRFCYGTEEQPAVLCIHDTDSKLVANMVCDMPFG
jgi:hypothetical protein